MTKKCAKCGEIKPLEDFHRETISPDGRRNSCKSCRNIPPEKKMKRTNNLKDGLLRECNRCGNNYIVKSYRQKYCEYCQILLDRERCNAHYHKTKVLIGRKHLVGENANGYKNGIALYPELAKTPGIKCNRCGSKAFLLVHHKDRNRENNSPENLEVLCKACHQFEHVEKDSLGKFSGKKPPSN